MATEYLSLKDLSVYSSLSVSTLRNIVNSGELQCFRLSRKILVKRTDFDYWAKRRQRQHRNINPMIKQLADQIIGAA
jgi:excisionase family DNA binding protein